MFFEGQAGAYPVHVIIQPAEVIPGLAQITVRVDSGQINQISALPLKWDVGRKGAPPPDLAKPVRGETNLYQAELWFMEPGPQSVELEIQGARGTGKVTVPVDAVATRVLTMSRGMGITLGVCGFLLVALLVTIVGAAMRESVLPPGEAASNRRIWLGRFAIALSSLVLITLLFGGRRWWRAEAADYRNNRLHKPTDADATVVQHNGGSVLRLEVPGFERSAPLVPDHGKLMHLFLVQHDTLGGFAHLHPTRRERMLYECPLPNLPPGRYDLYGDVTYETGSTETLTNSIELPISSAVLQSGRESFTPEADPDDSWCATGPLTPGSQKQQVQLSDDYNLSWAGPHQVRTAIPVRLAFAIKDRNGQPVTPESYLGMRGHLVLRDESGTVFTHLHPGGTASMAAMQLSTYRAEGKLPLRAAFGQDEPLCKLPVSDPAANAWANGIDSESNVSFPYAFPKPGQYRLWVQVKVQGKILTGVFDVGVEP